jgi:hypothetical protein
MDEGSRKDAEHMLINPFYAINITPDLMGEHEPLVSEAQWIAANKKSLRRSGFRRG